MVHVRTYHPPIHFIAPTTIPVLSPVLFIPSLYYTSNNSKNFFILSDGRGMRGLVTFAKSGPFLRSALQQP